MRCNTSPEESRPARTSLCKNSTRGIRHSAPQKKLRIKKYDLKHFICFRAARIEGALPVSYFQHRFAYQVDDPRRSGNHGRAASISVVQPTRHLTYPSLRRSSDRRIPRRRLLITRSQTSEAPKFVPFAARLGYHLLDSACRVASCCNRRRDRPKNKTNRWERFSAAIQPFLANNCQGCHNAQVSTAGLNLKA